MNKIEAELQKVCQMLFERMKTQKDVQRRDVSYLALKTVISEIDSSQTEFLASFLIPWTMECMQSENDELSSNGYDLMIEFLQLHPGSLESPSEVADLIVPELEKQRPGIRKKAMQCLANLAPSLDNPKFGSIVKALMLLMQESRSDPSRLHVFVQAMSFVARTAGYRLEKQIPVLVPFMIELAAIKEEEYIDVIESALIVLELCIAKATASSAPYFVEIANQATLCLKYDPNYEADTDMEEVMDDDILDNEGSKGGEAEDEDDDEDGAFSDDDDASWKVRRAACKLISSEIKFFSKDIARLYDLFQTPLIKRLSEREETVLYDVFMAYSVMLSSVRCGDAELREKITMDAPKLIRMLIRQLKHSSTKTKIWIYKVLLQLCEIFPECIYPYFSKLARDLELCIKDDSSASLQVQAITFVKQAFCTMPALSSYDEVIEIGNYLFEASGKSYFAVASEALLACKEMVRLIRPSTEDEIIKELATLVPQLFSVIFGSLSVQERPQEVKNAGLCCAGEAVSRLGDMLDSSPSEEGLRYSENELAQDFAAMPSDRNAKRAKLHSSQMDVDGLLPRLQDMVSLVTNKMMNETTRMSAIRSMQVIAKSPLNLDIKPQAIEALNLLRSFLRKSDRQLRLLSLETLSSIINRKDQSLDHSQLSKVIDDVSNLLSEDDMGVVNASVSLLQDICSCREELVSEALNMSYDKITSLLNSPTLQSTTLRKVEDLLATMAKENKSVADELINGLMDFGKGDVVPSASMGAACCIAAICSAIESQSTAAEVEKLSIEGISAEGKPLHQRFFLYCVRELGTRGLIRNRADSSLLNPVLCAMKNAEISDSAASALGGLSSGSETFFEMMLTNLRESTSPELEYHLLRALNESLRVLADRKTHLDVSICSILTDSLLLLVEKDMNEEVQSIIGECYGHAALMSAENVMGPVESLIQSSDPKKRITALLALKHCITDAENPMDNELREKWLPMGMGLLQDPEVDVRKVCVQLLGAGAYIKPGLVVHTIPQIIERVFEQTQPDPNLVRVVNLGPFKHKVDDGLELRKASFECIGVLMSKCWDNLTDVVTLANVISRGLSDEYDVKLKCHDLLCALASSAPGVTLSMLEMSIEPLTATLTAKIKNDAVKQEVDRNEDMIRSCLRAIDVLDHLDGSHEVIAFHNFMDKVVNAGTLKDKYAAIIRERKQIETM